MYKGIVRPLIEYAAPVYNPILARDVNRIEGIQRRATKMVIGLEDKTYEQRLRYLDLPTLKYRRNRGNMIQVYKYTHQLYDVDTTEMLPISTRSVTRGHNLKQVKNRSRLNIRANFFSQKVVNLWNNLTNDTVNSYSINTFKNRLDKEWKDKEYKYNIYMKDY